PIGVDGGDRRIAGKTRQDVSGYADDVAVDDAKAARGVRSELGRQRSARPKHYDRTGIAGRGGVARRLKHELVVEPRLSAGNDRAREHAGEREHEGEDERRGENPREVRIPGSLRPRTWTDHGALSRY